MSWESALLMKFFKDKPLGSYSDSFCVRVASWFFYLF